MRISKLKLIGFTIITSSFLGLAINTFFGILISQIFLSFYYLLVSFFLLSNSKLKIKINSKIILIAIIWLFMGFYTLFSENNITFLEYFLSLNSFLISIIFINELIKSNSITIFEVSVYYINCFLIFFTLLNIFRYLIGEIYLSSYLSYFLLPIMPLFILTNWQKLSKKYKKRFMIMRVLFFLNIIFGLLNITRFVFKVPYVLSLFFISFLILLILQKVLSKEKFPYFAFYYPLFFNSFIYLIFIFYPIFADADLINTGQLVIDARHNSLMYRALTPLTYLENNLNNPLILIFGMGIGSSLLRVNIFDSQFLQLNAILSEEEILLNFAPHDGIYYLFFMFGIVGFILIINLLWRIWKKGFEIKNIREKNKYFLIYSTLTLYFLILNISTPATIPGGYPESLFGFPCLLLAYATLIKVKSFPKVLL